MSLIAAPGPEDDRPELQRWWQLLREQRNLWAHARSPGVDPLDLLWRSAQVADVRLDWQHLSQAFLLLGLAELDRPAHVADLVRELADATGSRRVLDPYAVAPTFLSHIAEAAAVSEALGITPNADVARGVAEATPSKVRWIAGRIWEITDNAEIWADPGRGLDAPMVIPTLGQFDLIACSPPLGHAVREELPGDLPVSLYRRELAYWLLAKSDDHLSDEGRIAFHVADSFFTRQDGRQVLAWLAERGLHLKAGISLAAGAGPTTSVPTSIVVFDRNATDELFVGRIGPGQSPQRLVENLLSGRTGKAPENGLLVNRDEFRGWAPLQIQLDLKRRLRVSAAQIRPLSEVALEIRPLRLRKGQQHEPAENAIYIYETSNRITLDPPDAPVKEKSVFRAYEVALDPDVVSAEYVAWWLSTDIGQHARQGLNAGAYIPRISLDGVGQIQLVVPSLADQRAVLSLDERLKALRDEIAGIEEEIASRPQAAPQLSERLDAYWEDPLEAWVDRLPFPLASIIDRYIADTGVETQVDRLLHFFEAFAEFGVAILLAAIRRDEQVWAEHREQLAEPGPNGRHVLEEATFGGWTALGFKLAKALRSRIQQTDDADETRRTLFAIEDARFSADLTGTGLWNTLDKARLARNRLGHGEIVGAPAKRRLLAELQELLTQVREATERCFARALLVEPGPGEFDGEVHLHPSARHLRGASPNLRQRPLESLVQLKSRATYFVDPVARISAALELVPLFRLMPAPETEENTVYFTAGRDDNGYRLISYHVSSDPQPRVEPNPALDQLLRELSLE